MGKPISMDRLRSDFATLEADIRLAGCALACPYSSADEFEAAVIRARRNAGAFGTRRYRRVATFAGIATGALVVAALLLM